MIKAEHKFWAQIFFSKYINYILKKSFSHFYLVNEIPAVPDDKAVLIAPNHISWWDGFIIDYLNRIIYTRKIYVMMLEEQLKRYRFFSRIGAYSIDPGNLKEIKESLSYTKELLTDNNNLVVIYPQGVLTPFNLNYSPLKKGLLKITESPVSVFSVLPFACKISYYNERHPEIYIYFGSVMNSDAVENDFKAFETNFYDNIKAVNNASIERSYIKDMFE